MMTRTFDLGNRSRPSPAPLGLLLLAAVAGAPAHAQPVQGDVRSVGFQAAVPSRFVVRCGQWFPILVELTAQGSQAQDVELHCELGDLDGDRLAYIEPYVVVNPNSPRRLWCYAAILEGESGRAASVDVISRQDGALITRLPLPAFEEIGNDTQLILDISDKRVTGLDGIDSGGSTYLGLNLGNRRYYRTICVASLPIRNLPDRWWGLEAVDVIVWDEPDPDVLRDPAQLPALVEWVRNGGQLVVGIGPAWGKVQKSLLAEIMPLTDMQRAIEVRELRGFAARYARSTDEGFQAPLSVAIGQPAPDALVTFRERLPGLGGTEVNLIAMKCVGSGRVIATAARLRDLMSRGLKSDFYHALFDLNRNERSFLDSEGETVYLTTPWRPYEPLIGQIEFRRLASVRVLAAFAFVAAYILLSTFGAWTWLRRHALTHVSWTVFAAFAVVASLLSLGAVGLSRGVTGTVHSFSFADLEAGSSEVRVAAYFGYKSNRRQRVDLSLPGENSYLRPLTVGRDASASKYTTPERYTALTGDATLKDVLMRATLKQFEGFCHASLEGTIRGQLTADSGTGQITAESWLQNDLNMELLGGYLLYIDPRLRDRDGGVPYRVAGLNSRNDRPRYGNRYYGSETVPPAANVLAVALPNMEPGQKIDELGAEEYDRYQSTHARWALNSNPDPKREPMLPTLRHQQLDEWAPSLGTRVLGTALASHDAAALLASTRNLHLHNDRVTDFDKAGRPLSTAGLVDLDVTHWLTRGQAVLLLISDKPGPADLLINQARKKASAGRTIYRVRIPIRYTAGPPRGTTP